MLCCFLLYFFLLHHFLLQFGTGAIALGNRVECIEQGCRVHNETMGLENGYRK